MAGWKVEGKVQAAGEASMRGMFWGEKRERGVLRGDPCQGGVSISRLLGLNFRLLRPVWPDCFLTNLRQRPRMVTLASILVIRIVAEAANRTIGRALPAFRVEAILLVAIQLLPLGFCHASA